MDFSPIMPSLQAQRPIPAATQPVTAAVMPVAAGQQAMALTRTQTASAPAAVGRSDNSRDTRNGTQTGEAVDTRAAAQSARANGAPPRRGMTLDVSV